MDKPVIFKSSEIHSMQRKSTTRSLLMLLLSLSLLIFQSCSVGYYGDTVGEEVKRYRLLQDEYNRLESDYIVILENLTLSPNDEFLINERNRVSAEMLQIRNDLDLARQLKVKALRGLENEVVRKQTEEIFADSMKTDARQRLEKQLKKQGVNLNLME